MGLTTNVRDTDLRSPVEEQDDEEDEDEEGAMTLYEGMSSISVRHGR